MVWWHPRVFYREVRGVHRARGGCGCGFPAWGLLGGHWGDRSGWGVGVAEQWGGGTHACFLGRGPLGRLVALFTPCLCPPPPQLPRPPAPPPPRGIFGTKAAVWCLPQPPPPFRVSRVGCGPRFWGHFGAVRPISNPISAPPPKIRHVPPPPRVFSMPHTRSHASRIRTRVSVGSGGLLGCKRAGGGGQGSPA